MFDRESTLLEVNFPRSICYLENWSNLRFNYRSFVNYGWILWFS